MPAAPVLAACKAPGSRCRKASDCCTERCKKRRDRRTGKCTSCGEGQFFCPERSACATIGECCTDAECGGLHCCGGSCTGGACEPSAEGDPRLTDQGCVSGLFCRGFVCVA